MKLNKVVEPIDFYQSTCFCFLGEIYELKAELQSDRRERKKEALKKVRQNETINFVTLIHLGRCLYDRWQRCQSIIC